MSRRISAGWLVAAIVIVTGIGIAGSTIPLRPCRTCDGLIPELLSRFSVLPQTPPRLNCPDCADRGKETVFHSWMRPRVAEPLARFIRGLKGDCRGSLQSLEPVLEAEGQNLTPFLRHMKATQSYFSRACFMNVGQKKTLILLVNYCGTIMPGDSGAAVFLFTPDGRLLDFVHLTCSDRYGDLHAEFLNGSFADGAHVIVHPEPGSFLSVLPEELRYELYGCRQMPRAGVIRAPDAFGAGGISRIRIQGERLEVLTPR